MRLLRSQLNFIKSFNSSVFIITFSWCIQTVVFLNVSFNGKLIVVRLTIYHDSSLKGKHFHLSHHPKEMTEIQKVVNSFYV